MDSSKNTEDDTLRDPMEQGYVATRPRGTRARDTWKVNVRNLVAEDKRALDYFQKEVAKRGSNAFLFPNLIQNGSFEFPACSGVEFAQGWTLTDGATSALNVALTTIAEDGTAAVLFATVAGQMLTAGSYQAQDLQNLQAVPCTPGDVYLLRARVNCTPGTLANRGDLMFQATVTTYDANGNATFTTAGFPVGNVSTPGWQDYTATFTVPAGVVSFRLGIRVVLGDASGALNFDGSASVTVDEVGCGLLTPAQMYGRMAGSDALPRPVRFAKLPEFSDIGIGNGVKRYGVNFEVTEL